MPDTKKKFGPLYEAMQYTSNNAAEDVQAMLGVINTAGTSSGLGDIIGGPLSSGGALGTPREYVHTVPVVPAAPNPFTMPSVKKKGGLLGSLGITSGYEAAHEERLGFEEIIQKIALALEHLSDEEMAEQLKAAKQINILANQILAITFQSGLGDVEISQALVAEAQALKTRALAILRGILDFINEETEEGEDEEDA